MRTEELRGGAQRVTILTELTDVSGDVLLLLDSNGKLGTIKKPGDRFRNFNLSGVWAGDSMNEGREGPAGTEHGLRAHRRGHLSEERHMNGFMDSKRTHRRRERRAVQDTQVLL